MTSGYYLLQGSLLKLAWGYPVLIAPLGVGCLALAMDFNEVAAADALWLVVHTVLNATWWVGGLVADRFGEPAGRVETANFAIYDAFPKIALGAIFVGRSARSMMRYLFHWSREGGRRRMSNSLTLLRFARRLLCTRLARMCRVFATTPTPGLRPVEMRPGVC